jgi:hypothetical protein
MKGLTGKAFCKCKIFELKKHKKTKFLTEKTYTFQSSYKLS